MSATWGEKNTAPPFRLGADLVADLNDQVRASRLAQPENLLLVAQASQNMGAFTAAVALRRSREEIVRKALATMCFLARVVEEGDAGFSEGRDMEEGT
jgi:hypothetical protein